MQIVQLQLLTRDDNISTWDLMHKTENIASKE